MPLATFRCMYFNTYRSISNKNRRSYNYAIYIYPSNIFFWRKLNPHNKWKCVRCWKWKKSCAIGPYENIHKVYYYATVRFIFYLFYSLMWQFFLKPIVKIYNNTSKQNLFFTWKKIWFENFLLRHLTLLKNIKGINKLFFEVLDIY